MASLTSVGETLGVILVTGILCAVLYGVTTVQTFIYHQHSKHDPRMLKHSITFLWILDTVTFIFMTHYLYHYCVLNFANLDALNTLPWSIPAYILTCAVGDIIVIGWFAHRLWKLSVSRWLILVIAAAALTILVGACYLTALSLKYPDIPTFNKIGGWAWYLKFGPQIFSEIVITAVLTRILLLRRTGFAKTTSIIHTLIAYSISSCLITSVVSIAVVVTVKTHPDKTYQFGFASLVPKLLLNSLLAMLNSRELFKTVGHGDVKPVPIQLSHLPDSGSAQSDTPRDSESRDGSKPHIKIHVDKSVTESYQV
ncbi:hypothetical protein BDW22DRAFT_1360565 [Trametopsis cervina]|nr:hypothetical protein BDW22DRAFT_1360565 [Trametopsis cervina]